MIISDMLRVSAGNAACREFKSVVIHSYAGAFEIIEARIEHSMIFYTQYHAEGRYDRINSDPGNYSHISDAIIDRIINNAYDVVIDVEGNHAKMSRTAVRRGAVTTV